MERRFKIKKVMGEIFKAYDIRGIYPSELNEDTIYKIGRAYATLLQEENQGKKLNIVAGQDMRLSSPQLFEVLVKGLTDQGVNVVDVGLVSTPTFYFAVAHYGYDGGVQVSASHNPKEYNGLKLCRENAIPISGDTGIQEIKELFEKEDFMASEEKGKIIQKDILEGFLEHNLKFVNQNLSFLLILLLLFLEIE